MQSQPGKDDGLTTPLETESLGGRRAVVGGGGAINPIKTEKLNTRFVQRERSSRVHLKLIGSVYN